MNWIDSSIKKPDENDYFICFLEDRITHGFYFQETFWDISSGFYKEIIYPTHWIKWEDIPKPITKEINV